jgi:serine/threonine protein kinase/WD40 repeat protein/Flp pilus assembly protein TadD
MTQPPPSDCDPLVALAEEFVGRYRKGERPALSEYTARHPDLAGRIRDLFPALVVMEAAGSTAGAEVGPAPLVERPPALERLGEFRILRKVGEGGMGVVYEAVQESLGRHVALKVLPPGRRGGKFLERFRREARAAAKLHHTNIVPVFGVGEADGTHYYAMQFIPGQGLDAVLNEVRRLRADKTVVASAPDATAAYDVARSLIVGVAEPAPPPEEPGADPTPTLTVSSGASELIGQPEQHYYRGVARLGVQAAEALAHAHAQGVLHRDVKPSNLLLDAHGTLWVTDFGLAKADDEGDLTGTGDLIGTLRYMAPERFQGRSDARSDVYALGMTLYELLTLRSAFAEVDRLKLIDSVCHTTPPRPRSIDARIPRDLETVVLKAAARDPADRYQTAAALADDLRQFLADRPIKARRASWPEQLWRWRRRNPVVAALVGAVAGLLLSLTAVSVVAAVVLEHRRGESDASRVRAEAAETEVRESLTRAEQAKREKTEQLLNAKLALARAGRFSARPGRRFDSLRALGEAAQIARALNLPDDSLRELRDEAVACLALLDVRPGRVCRSPEGFGGAAFDPGFEHYACWDPAGRVSIRRVEDSGEAAAIPGPGRTPPGSVSACVFSPDGRWLAVTYAHKGTNEAVVWDWRQGEPVLTDPTGTWVTWSGDGRWLAVQQPGASVRVYDPATRREVNRLDQTDSNAGLAFHPDGERIAVVRGNRVVLRDVRTGRELTSFTHPAPPKSLAWRGDGRLLAVGAGQLIHVWDTAAPAQPRAVLKGHVSEGISVAFSRAGDFLVSNCWDGTVRFWDPWAGTLLLEAPLGWSGSLRLSRDDRWFTGGSDANAFFEVVPGRECRALYGHAERSKGPWTADFSPDGRLLASAGDDGVRLWDAADGRLALAIDVGAGAAVFSAGDGGLVTAGASGTYFWPAKADGPDGLRFGPPYPFPRREGGGRALRVARDPHGRRWAVLQPALSQALFIRSEKPDEPIIVRPVGNAHWVAVSPDGRWVAVCNRTKPETWVFDAETGRLTHKWPGLGACLGFSPCGRWLVTGSVTSHEFWRVGTWEPERKLERAERNNVPGPLAFSPDGRLLAVAHSGRAIRLLEPETGRLVATLTAPAELLLADLRFSPDGGRLAAATEGHAVQLWDLRLIRQQLAEIGLDWDHPAPPPPAAGPAPRVTADSGNLARPQSAPPPANPQRPANSPQAVIEKTTAALKANPDDVEAYHQRGHALERAGRYAAAVEDFSEALRRRPDDAHFLACRGMDLGKLGRHPAAVADLERSLALRPNQAQPCNNLAWLRATAPPPWRDPAGAVALAEQAVKLAPANATYLNTLGVALCRAGRFREAVRPLEESLARGGGPLEGFNLYFLAVAHHALGDRAAARDCFDRAARWHAQTRLTDHAAAELAAFGVEAAVVTGRLPIPVS